MLSLRRWSSQTPGAGRQVVGAAVVLRACRDEGRCLRLRLRGDVEVVTDPSERGGVVFRPSQRARSARSDAPQVSTCAEVHRVEEERRYRPRRWRCTPRAAQLDGDRGGLHHPALRRRPYGLSTAHRDCVTRGRRSRVPPPERAPRGARRGPTPAPALALRSASAKALPSSESIFAKRPAPGLADLVLPPPSGSGPPASAADTGAPQGAAVRAIRTDGGRRGRGCLATSCARRLSPVSQVGPPVRCT